MHRLLLNAMFSYEQKREGGRVEGRKEEGGEKEEGRRGRRRVRRREG